MAEPRSAGPRSAPCPRERPIDELGPALSASAPTASTTRTTRSPSRSSTVPTTPTFPLLGPVGLLPAPTKWRNLGAPIELGARARARPTISCSCGARAVRSLGAASRRARPSTRSQACAPLPRPPRRELELDGLERSDARHRVVLVRRDEQVLAPIQVVRLERLRGRVDEPDKLHPLASVDSSLRPPVDLARARREDLARPVRDIVK